MAPIRTKSSSLIMPKVLKSASGLASGAQRRCSAKYAADAGDGRRLSLTKQIVFRIVNSSAHGTLLAAVTRDGRPCALLLDPTKQDSNSHAHMLQDLQKRFPSDCSLMNEDDVVATDHHDARSTLDALVSFCVEQQEAKHGVTLASYRQSAKKLQAQSILYGSPFQISIWRAMMSVDVGQTVTYAQLALRAGLDAKAVRAVAQACGANPLTLLFPCHRIVAANGATGGYHWGVTTKLQILGDEQRLTSTECNRAMSTKPPTRTMKLLRTV